MIKIEKFLTFFQKENVIAISTALGIIGFWITLVGFVFTIYVMKKTKSIDKILKYNKTAETYNKNRTIIAEKLKGAIWITMRSYVKNCTYGQNQQLAFSTMALYF